MSVCHGESLDRQLCMLILLFLSFFIRQLASFGRIFLIPAVQILFRTFVEIQMQTLRHTWRSNLPSASLMIISKRKFFSTGRGARSVDDNYPNRNVFRFYDRRGEPWE